MRSWVGFVAMLLVASTASAQTRAGGKDEARRHFHEGVTLARSGSLDAAIRAFQAAYAIEPHYAVLYNVGQAELALGKAAAAIATFERYLAEGGRQVSEARRTEVSALIASARKRVGAIRVSLQSRERTRVWLDGAELSAEELDQPLQVDVGEHNVLSSTASGAPSVQKVAVSTGETTEVLVAAPRELPEAVAQLRIHCGIPGMQIALDDRPLGKTPLDEPLLVPVGERVLTVRRAGYRPLERRLALTAGELEQVTCDERLQQPLALPLRASFHVQATPADSKVSIDGRPFHGSALPSGEHELRVERDGYVAYRHNVSLRAGRPLTFYVTLRPTAEWQMRVQRANDRQKTIGRTLGGAGALLLLGAGGLFVWNQGRYSEWQASPSGDSDLNQVASLQRVDDVSLGLALLGTGLAVGGMYLLFTEADVE